LIGSIGIWRKSIPERRQAASTACSFLKRRIANEPVTCRNKHDQGMVCNFLLSKAFNSMNAKLTACGFNPAKLMRFLVQSHPTWLCAL
jgi:hypothetical protein